MEKEAFEAEEQWFAIAIVLLLPMGKAMERGEGRCLKVSDLRRL